MNHVTNLSGNRWHCSLILANQTLRSRPVYELDGHFDVSALRGLGPIYKCLPMLPRRSLLFLIPQKCDIISLLSHISIIFTALITEPLDHVQPTHPIMPLCVGLCDKSPAIHRRGRHQRRQDTLLMSVACTVQRQQRR